jgi:hypothetical protein
LHFEIKSLDEASAAIQHISATAEGCVKRNGSDTREIVKSNDTFTLKDGDRYHFVSAWDEFFIQAVLEGGAAVGVADPEKPVDSPRAMAEDDVELDDSQERVVDDDSPVEMIVDEAPVVVIDVLDSPSTPATPGKVDAAEDSPFIRRPKNGSASRRRWGTPSPSPVGEESPAPEVAPKSPSPAAEVPAVGKAPKRRRKGSPKRSKIVTADPQPTVTADPQPTVTADPPQPIAGGGDKKKKTKPPGGEVPKKMRKGSKFNVHGYLIDAEFMDDPDEEYEMHDPLTLGAGALVRSFTSKNQVTMKKLDAFKASEKITDIVSKDEADGAKSFDCGKPITELHPMLRKMYVRKQMKAVHVKEMFSEPHSELDLEIATAVLAQATADIAAEKAAAART